MRKTTIAVALLGSALSAVPATVAFAQDKGQARSEDKSKAKSADKAAAKDQSKDGVGTAILLVPLAFATDRNLANGCWARLYDGENFKGDALSLVGPVDLPHMRSGFGYDWGRKYDSIVVGSKATLTVYDNVNYREKTATFKPDQTVPDLNEKMGFFQNIRSLKITCSK